MISFPSIQKRQVVETGLLVVAGCLLTGLVREQAVWYKAALISTLLTLLVPWIFFPVAVVWFALGHLLSQVTSKVLLVLIFVGLVVPVAWVRRWLGKDALRMRTFKKGTDSVFVPRNHTFRASDLQYPF